MRRRRSRRNNLLHHHLHLVTESLTFLTCHIKPFNIDIIFIIIIIIIFLLLFKECACKIIKPSINSWL